MPENSKGLTSLETHVYILKEDKTQTWRHSRVVSPERLVYVSPWRPSFTFQERASSSPGEILCIGRTLSFSPSLRRGVKLLCILSCGNSQTDEFGIPLLWGKNLLCTHRPKHLALSPLPRRGNNEG